MEELVALLSRRMVKQSCTMTDDSLFFKRIITRQGRLGGEEKKKLLLRHKKYLEMEKFWPNPDNNTPASVLVYASRI